MTEILLGALIFAGLVGVFYAVEHWADLEIDEHEAMTFEPEQAQETDEDTDHG